jgi:hypothetical protein
MPRTALLTQDAAVPKRIHVPVHGKGVLHPFQPGQSGNPTGKGGLYHEAQRICREASPQAARRMVELMNSDDERVALLAADKVLERAWGKAKEVSDEVMLDPAAAERAAQQRAEVISLLQRMARAEPLSVESDR